LKVTSHTLKPTHTGTSEIHPNSRNTGLINKIQRSDAVLPCPETQQLQQINQWCCRFRSFTVRVLWLVVS